MNMLGFSNHVIALANEYSDGITNLELQKVMYFAMGSYIKENDIDSYIRSIYDEPFEAWPYGPVVRSVYFEHKLNGRSKIEAISTINDLYNPLNAYVIKFLDVPVKKMVEDSHEHLIWKDNKSKIMQHDLVEYKLEDIRDAFDQ